MRGERAFIAGDPEGRCVSWDIAMEDAQERLDLGDAEVVIHELRPTTVDDIDLDGLTSDVWGFVGDVLWEHEGLACDEGGADLAKVEPGSPEFARLREALLVVLRERLDLSDAAWRPTGRSWVVTRDSVTEVTRS